MMHDGLVKMEVKGDGRAADDAFFLAREISYTHLKRHEYGATVFTRYIPDVPDSRISAQCFVYHCPFLSKS